MSRRLDPVSVADELESSYRRYLETTFYFKDPDLRASFREALRSGHLMKGPYLEATPVFRRGATPRSLFPEFLGEQPHESFLAAMDPDRPLYSHQEQAVRSVFGERRNVVVATGTASGKTEAFLLPILLHLYSEFQAQELGPGTRALILYPMNALANDQRERLGAICRHLAEAGSPFRFTFGQYIGETPQDESDARRHAEEHMAARLPGELVLRSEIREQPPHILLTNYSMLEYLLIRPQDSPLFDAGRARWWTFLVLDEAHQYRGAKGIEMGMLLRRLKRRLREGGRAGPFRCIATSATLTRDEGDKQAVAEFASNLFDEPFEARDVVLGETVPIEEPTALALNASDYSILTQALRTDCAEGLPAVASRLNLQLDASLPTPDQTGHILRLDRRSAELRRRTTGEPQEVSRLAREVFPEVPRDQQVSSLVGLVELLCMSREPASGARLLSARYHVFLRSLEGAFLSYVPADHKFRVLLEPHDTGDASTLFELALCRECGQHYLVGRVEAGNLREAIRDPGDPDFGATFFRLLGQDERNAVKKRHTRRSLWDLCPQCGAICEAGKAAEGALCPHRHTVLVERQERTSDREDQMPQCTACGYHGPDPVREVIHGTDGPHAVICTALRRTLPPGREKILAFADSRQEAAFFAWYLEHSYRSILERSLILQAALDLFPHAPDGLCLRDMALGLRDLYRAKGVAAHTASDLSLLRDAWVGIYREFLTDERRISLEGVGALRWSLKWPANLRMPPSLLSPPLSLDDQEAHQLVETLLDFVRSDRAVELRPPPGVAVNWHDLQLDARQTRVRIGPPRKSRNVRSWDGKTGRRAQFLAKLLRARGIHEAKATTDAVRILREVWEALRDADESTPSGERILLTVGDGRRLNPDWWRAAPLAPRDLLYQCDTCASLQPTAVGGLCRRHGCPGKVCARTVAQLEENHYRTLYQADLGADLRAEEHTAQIDRERARELQREFKAGRIDVLSSSTTFELGVDLGDLDTIFLRNVPPEPFNYAQRVGRAGRRSNYPGFAVTYCRRTPHDLYHFGHPTRILRGRIAPPVVSLSNERIILRHMVAHTLSSFFRENPGRFDCVEHLLADLADPTALRDFALFLRSRHDELEESLHAITPPPMRSNVGLSDDTWIEKLAGPTSRFADVQQEAASDFGAIQRFKETCVEREDYRSAQWAQARASTMAKEDVLSFLSRKATIPKYGFPVDVVELDTHRTHQGTEASEVLLQRDLAIAIAEFAPGSAVVANKRVWKSYGLKTVVGEEWPRRAYVRCPHHNLFACWDLSEEPVEPCCASAVQGQYIWPRFGFVTDRSKPTQPRRRPARQFTTRPYFVRLLSSPSQYTTHRRRLELTKASPALMVVICEGPRGAGFYICPVCGAGFTARKGPPHETPWGQPCHGCLERTALGHEFVTDVVQLEVALQPRGSRGESVWWAYSLAYALLEGAAEVMEAPAADLNATVAYAGTDTALPPVVLYDNVPGGAGLVARLEDPDMLTACLEAALQRVSGQCGCPEEESCYRCLRSYRNQFAHQHLRRGYAKAAIQAILD